MTDDQKSRLITDSLSLIRSITEIHGPEQGMQLWSKISEVLDPTLKGQIFFSMITGEHDDQLTITGINSPVSRINVIKALRSITGGSLKETKDLVDGVIDTRTPIKIKIPPGTRYETTRILCNAGCLL